MSQSDIFDKVSESIQNVRPYLQADGGDISLVEITSDFTVKVQLHGACGSCPYSLMTLRNGVEEVIKRDVPQVKAVEAVNLEI